MIHVFIRLADRQEPFIETVGNYMFDEKGNLRLYDKDKMWFFPYTNLRYVFMNENWERFINMMITNKNQEERE